MTNLQLEKQKIKQEKLARKLAAMSPERRQKYMTKLAVRMRLEEAAFKDKESHLNALERIPNRKKLSAEAVSAVIGTHAVGGAVAGGFVGANFSTGAGDIGAGAFVGLVLGGAIGVANGFAYEGRPVTNAITKIRIYLADKKLSKLENSMEMNEYLVGEVEQQEIFTKSECQEGEGVLDFYN